MINSSSSIHDVQRVLLNAQHGKTLRAKANSSNSLASFANQLKELCKSADDIERELKGHKLLDRQLAQIVGNICDAKPGDSACTIWFHYQRFEISQPDPHVEEVHIRDLDTNNVVKVTDISLPLLQKRMFQLFVREKSNLGEVVKLSSFKLSHFKLAGISFFDTELSRKNFDDIVAGGGDLTGARLEEDADVTDLDLTNIYIDKTMANSLIMAGFEPKAVLKSYINNPSPLLNKQHKTDMLNEYIRKADKQPVDLGGIDFRYVYTKQLHLNGSLLDQDNIDAIIAGGGNLIGATLSDNISLIGQYLHQVNIDKPVATQLIAAGANKRSVVINFIATEHSLKHTHISLDGFDLTNTNLCGIDLTGVDTTGIVFSADPDEQHIKNFEHDLLQILTIYSQTIASVFIQSSSLDILNGAIEKFNNHHNLLDAIRNRYPSDNPDRIGSTIKTSTGNCREMGLMCKSMLDLYLKKSLAMLGYQNVFCRSSYMHTRRPSDHGAAKLQCTFQGLSNIYVIDPWSKGQAWSLANATNYFSSRKSDRFVRANFQFFDDIKATLALENPEYQAKIRTIFDIFKIKEQLDAAIIKNKSRFKNSGGS